jgi:hypothetical protein
MKSAVRFHIRFREFGPRHRSLQGVAGGNAHEGLRARRVSRYICAGRARRRRGEPCAACAIPTYDMVQMDVEEWVGWTGCGEPKGAGPMPTTEMLWMAGSSQSQIYATLSMTGTKLFRRPGCKRQIDDAALDSPRQATVVGWRAGVLVSKRKGCSTPALAQDADGHLSTGFVSV